MCRKKASEEFRRRSLEFSKEQLEKAKIDQLKAKKAQKLQKQKVVENNHSDSVADNQPVPVNVQKQPVRSEESSAKRRLDFGAASLSLPVAIQQRLLAILRGYRDRKLFHSKYVNNIKRAIRVLHSC